MANSTLSGDTYNHIAVVEDDPQVAALILRQLARYGFTVHLVGDLQQVDGEIRSLRPNLVLLDINLPHLDGFHWCRAIRRFSTVPIVFISSRGSNMDQVFALENGGDDYIQKPFDMDVVVAKLRALLRRTYGEYTSSDADADATVPTVYRRGDFMLDVRKSHVQRHDKVIAVTKTELELLQQLISADGHVVTRNRLLDALWDDTNFVDDNTLTVNVARLRHKLAEIGVPDAIITVRGLGYRFEAPEEDPSNPPKPTDQEWHP